MKETMSMILKEIHRVGQRYFPIPSYLIHWIICVYGIYRAFTGNFLEWLGPLETALPFGFLMLRIQAKKNMLRTNRTPLVAAAFCGVLLSGTYSWISIQGNGKGIISFF